MSRLFFCTLVVISVFIFTSAPLLAIAENKIEVITARVASFEKRIIKLEGEGTFLPAPGVGDVSISPGQLVTLKYYEEGKEKKFYTEVKVGAMTIIPMVPQN